MLSLLLLLNLIISINKLPLLAVVNDKRFMVVSGKGIGCVQADRGGRARAPTSALPVCGVRKRASER